MRRAKRQRKKEQKVLLKVILKFVLPVLILICGLLYLKLNTRYWDGKNKLVVVSQEQSGNVKVKVYDPGFDELVLIDVSGETEVKVSRNLGTLRLKNVWQLGVNEGIGGDLLAQTVTRNLMFPVFLWQGPNRETNVSVGDRLMIWMFEKRTKNLERNEIDLAKAQFIKKQKLRDGEMGYIIPANLSERVTAFFADNEFISVSPKISIKDATGVGEVATKVGTLIETMGGKVVNIERVEPQQINCTVSGMYAGKIANIFDCEVKKVSESFDLQVTLGTVFADKF